MKIIFKDVELEAKFKDGDFYFRHPITGEWVENPAQLWVGWKEQDPEVQEQWKHLRKVAENDPDLEDYIIDDVDYIIE